MASTQATLKYTLVGTAGGNDPLTGDIYRGLDLFGRIKDLIWYNTATTHNLDEIQHGYDRAGNRLYRADPVDSQDQHDELYFYDGLYRIHDLIRGSLNATKNGIVNPTFAQCWSLDETGNWGNFRQASTGGIWDLVQNRMSNQANEITLLNNLVGPSWVTPVYNAAGNMTTLPQPATPGSSFTAVYDAWNRPVKLSAGGNTVAQHQYDGLNRRTVKLTYSGGVLSETRHFFYSASWQVLEERVGSSTSPNRQFVWGQGYADNLVLRDRDTTGSGTLNERFYALQDPNQNVTGLVDTTGAVQERYAYSAYGMPAFLTGNFGPRSASQFAWEILMGGYRWDVESSLYAVRLRQYHPNLGCWLSRDPVEMDVNLYRYCWNNPTRMIDPSGAGWIDLAANLLFALGQMGIGGGVPANVPAPGPQPVLVGGQQLAGQLGQAGQIAGQLGQAGQTVTRISQAGQVARGIGVAGSFGRVAAGITRGGLAGVAISGAIEVGRLTIELGIAVRDYYRARQRGRQLDEIAQARRQAERQRQAIRDAERRRRCERIEEGQRRRRSRCNAQLPQTPTCDQYANFPFSGPNAGGSQELPMRPVAIQACRGFYGDPTLTIQIGPGQPSRMRGPLGVKGCFHYNCIFPDQTFRGTCWCCPCCEEPPANVLGPAALLTKCNCNPRHL